MTENENTTPFNENEGRGEGYVRNEFNPNNYLNTKLAPGETKKKMTIRILPIEKGTNKINAKIKMHQLKVDPKLSPSGYIKMQCLNDEESKVKDERGCPFCKRCEEFRNEARKYPKSDERNKAFWDQSKIYSQKDFYIIRCIDRDHEDEGVKYWRFAHHWDGTGIMDQLKEIFFERRSEKEKDGIMGYDVFSVENGRDITVTITKDPNKKGAAYNIIDKSKEYPVTNDPEQLDRWLSETSWKDMYSAKKYDYMEIVLNGGIPKWSKKDGRYKTVEEVEAEEKEAETYNGSETQWNGACNQQSTINNNDNNSGSDLPF